MSSHWRLIAGHHPEGWFLALLLAAATIAIAEAVISLLRPRSPLPRRIRGALFGLRLLGIAAVAVILCELTLVLEEWSPRGARVIVLADRSASMGLADAESPGAPPRPRIDRLRELWAASADARGEWERQGWTVDVLSFAEDLAGLPGEAAENLSFATDGEASDLTAALTGLAQARTAGEGPAPAAVIVLSDGLVTRDPSAEAPLLHAVDSLGVPITTVAAGAPVIRDLAIARVRAGEFAFVENVSEIDAEVIAHGCEGEALTITLERDGEVIATTQAIAPAAGVPLPINFVVAPDRVGHFVYSVAVAPVTDEATEANNRRSFVVKVLRDKVRVLHVAGRPDWDVRALRTLLGRDPNVELLSFYILRGLDDSDREDPSAPMSLIAFPTDQLFAEELGSFDLVLLHNFDALAHQVGRYLDDIAAYVEGGGSLVMIGGDLGLATGDYRDGRLGAVLPVAVRRPAGLEIGEFRPTLSDAGRRHPITAWLRDPALEGWQGLPALDSFNRLRLREGSDRAALLLHPSGAPLLAVAEPGKGRSVVLATGASWRLGFAADLPRLAGARPYDHLWLGIIRWLLRDPAAERLSLEVAPPTVAPGEPLELRAAALSPTYAPEAGVALDWVIRPLGTAEEAPAVASGAWETDALGRAAATVGPLEIGAYEVIAQRREVTSLASALREGEDPPRSLEGAARRVILVEPSHRELAEVDAAPGEVRLAELARRSGGVALRARAGDRLPRTLTVAPSPGVTGDPRGGPGLEVTSRRELPLWDGLPALALLALALGSEWILRRRFGLA